MPTRIASTNLAATAASLAASTTAGALAASNLLTLRKGEVWRATGTSASLTLTWATAIAPTLVALPFCNLTAAATLRVRGYTLAADTDPAWDSPAAACALPLAGWPTYAVRWLPVSASSPPVEKIVIDIADAGNPASYVQAGMLVVAQHWEPELGPDVGARLGASTTAQRQRTDDGDPLHTPGARWRTLTFDLGFMSEADRATLWQIAGQNGMTQPAFVSVFAAQGNTPAEHAHQIYGLFDLPTVELPHYQRFATTITLQEV